jgi:hypothetical protein
VPSMARPGAEVSAIDGTLAVIDGKTLDITLPARSCRHHRVYFWALYDPNYTQ